MITIYPKNDFKTGFLIVGHAEYEEHGKDIVCAAVSAIAQTILAGLVDACDAEEVGAFVKEGYMDVAIFNPDEKTDLLMRAFVLGVEQIAKQYPDYVKISTEEHPF